MALCPFAEQHLLPESRTQPGITPVGVIDHTVVGGVEGTDYYFREITNVETHFGIRKDGVIWQWMPTTVRADGNYQGNLFGDGLGYVSIETAGYPDEPWTPEQVDALVKLHVWLAQTHDGIAHRVIRECFESGFGYHVIFGSPSCLTPVSKSCPGPARIRQWETIVIPRTLAVLAGEEDDMEPIDLLRIEQRQWGTNPPDHPNADRRGKNRNLAEVLALLVSAVEDDAASPGN